MVPSSNSSTNSPPLLNITSNEYNTPCFMSADVSRFLTFLTVASYLFLHSIYGHVRGFDLLAFDYDQLVDNSQFQRLVLHTLTFSTPAELIVGLLILTPLFRRFEREMGSRSFLPFIIKSVCLSTFFQYLLLEFLLHEDVQYLTGPYPQLGAMLYLFHAYTPRLNMKFLCACLGLNLSEKCLTYIMVFWFATHAGLGSSLPTLCGFLAGALSISVPFRNWDFPDSLYSRTGELAVYLRLVPVEGYPVVDQVPCVTDMMRNMHARWTTPSNTTNTRTNRRRPRLAPEGPLANLAIGGVLTDPIPTAPLQPLFQSQHLTPPPDSDAIEQLVCMGFEREKVLRALRECHNNVELTANLLLSG